MACRRIGDEAIIWTNAEPVHRHIYAALGGDGLNEGLAYLSLNYIIIGSDNELEPVWHLTVTWTNDEILLITRNKCQGNWNEIAIVLI